ncbi:MAG: type IV pilus biogenesis/stability protein PilW [Rubrivivax sp.]|nr:type IV pilus biogenesis/stability protein PilW [Rubrivivax sp.]
MSLRLASGWMAMVAVALLGACTSTTTVTTTNTGSAGGVGNDTRSSRGGSDAADAERRAKVRLELAGLYLARGQASTALEEVKLAIAAKPDVAEAYNLQGLIYGSLGELKLADESFRRALQLNPRDGDTMHNYGWFLCQQRQFAEAEAQFEAALLQPQYREVVRTLLAQGVCQARDGRWAQAERTLSRSYELDPSNPVTAYNLSEVLLQRGELERARFYVRRINARPELSTAQSLWLAARIERRLGNLDGVQDYGRQLRDRFPQAPETLQFERGRFDD